jgi:hypothetical protein
MLPWNASIGNPPQRISNQPHTLSFPPLLLSWKKRYKTAQVPVLSLHLSQFYNFTMKGKIAIEEAITMPELVYQVRNPAVESDCT